MLVSCSEEKPGWSDDEADTDVSRVDFSTLFNSSIQVINLIDTFVAGTVLLK